MIKRIFLKIGDSSAKDEMSGRMLLYAEDRLVFIDEASGNECTVQNPEVLVNFLFSNFPAAGGGDYMYDIPVNLYGTISDASDFIVSKAIILGKELVVA